MESFYYYIVIAGVCSFLTNESASKFRGSSGYVKLWLSVCALAGILSFVLFVVTLFFYVTWWHPIVIFFVTIGLSWLFGSFGRNGFAGLVYSVFIVVFNLLSWVYLIKYI